MGLFRKICRYTVCGILCLLLHYGTQAQKRSYVFVHHTVEDGLRTNQVLSLLCDSRGYMWAGTYNGLQRYNGAQYQFINFPFGESVSQETVQRMYEDVPAHTLWFVMRTGVISYNYYNNTYALYPVLHGRREGSIQIGHISRDHHGLLWVIGTQDDAFILDTSRKAFVPYNQLFPQAPARITNVLGDPATGNYIIGTAAGICVLDYRTKKYYTHDHNPLHIPYLDVPELALGVSNLYITRHGLMYVNIWPQNFPTPTLYQYNLHKKQLRNLSNFATGNYPGIFEDGQHQTWLGGDELLQLDSTGNAIEVIMRDRSSRYGLDFSQLYHVTIDRMQNIWLATNNGIYIFNKEKQQFITTRFVPGKQQPPEFEPQDITEGNNGDIYVASWGQGLLVYDSTLTVLKKNFRHPTERFFNLGWNLVRDHEGKIWMAAQHGRLVIADPKNGQVRYERSDSFDNSTIRCITMAADHNLWMGTQRGLIVKYDVQTRQYTRFHDSLYPARPLYGHILDINADAHNNIWVATGAYGLLQLDGKTGNLLSRYAPDEPVNKILHNTINNVQTQGDSIILASGGGINVIDTRSGRIISITEKDGLPIKQIMNVQLDGRNLYFTTNYSMGKINMDTRKVVNYGRKYGIADETFEIASNTRLANGRIAFGSSKSLISFFPDRLIDPLPPPDVHIISLQLGNRSLDADAVLQHGNELQLPSKQNSVTIGYNSMAYLDQDNITYYYQLEGVDASPVRADKRLLVNYSNLPIGRHTFKVWCENGEGFTSAGATSFTLIVPRPFYRQWWFYLLGMCILAGIIYLGYRIRINHLLATEKVRRRIARDLHDDMGSTLTSINIMTTVAKRHVQQDTAKTEEFLLKISDSTTRMMESMDDIVWSINPNNDSMHMIVARMREFTTSMFEPKEIGFTFHVDESVHNLKLDLESRHDFFMIFKESINNIAKHAQCTFVEIGIKYKKRLLLMQVKDNGNGFEQAGGGNGDGLFNMQRRAQRMKGSLEIQSEPGFGTRISLRFTTT